MIICYVEYFFLQKVRLPALICCSHWNLWTQSEVYISLVIDTACSLSIIMNSSHHYSRSVYHRELCTREASANCLIELPYTCIITHTITRDQPGPSCLGKMRFNVRLGSNFIPSCITIIYDSQYGWGWLYQWLLYLCVGPIMGHCFGCYPNETSIVNTLSVKWNRCHQIAGVR